MRGVLIAVGTILGVVGGAVLGFFATYWWSVLYDAVAVGWVFCFITVPVGAAIGGVAGALVTALVTSQSHD